MGFRSNTFARVWEEVRRDTANQSPKWVTVRMSVSRKNKETGQYDQEFSGFVSLVGAACAEYLGKLQQSPLPFSVRLGDVDVRSYYNKDTKQSRYDFTVFSFAPENQQGQYQHPATAPASGHAPAPAPAPAPAQQQYNRPQAQQYQQPAQPQYNQPQQTQYQQQPFQQAPAAPAPAGGDDYSIPEIDEELPFN